MLQSTPPSQEFTLKVFKAIKKKFPAFIAKIKKKSFFSAFLANPVKTTMTTTTTTYRRLFADSFLAPTLSVSSVYFW